MNTKLCPSCKTSIPANAPGGFCPGCILRDADELPPIGRTALSLEEVRAAFPQLEVLELIGQGGMGFVYKARQPSLDRTVALKILSPELGRDPAFAERFAREARVLGKLNHPNIVTVFEHGESGGFFYLIMEHVDGVNLRQAMRAGRFTPAQALAVVPGICDALQAAHAQGVWHRDIKPENILLDAQGGVKIVDFGIARIVGDPQRDFTLTMTGAALGSAAYMAPEQHESPHNVDHRADIYSLGVVIYEMLTGELPLGRFKAPSTKAAVDARIDEIVFRTLEKERELRQQSANEVKTDVFNAANTPAMPQSQPNSPLSRLPNLTMRSLALLIGGAIAGGTGWAIMATMRSAAAGGAVVAGIGSLAFVFGFLGALWALYEMKRGWISPIGRNLLIAFTLVPAVIACIPAALGSALATGVPAIKGSILVLAALIIAGLGIAFSLIFKLARPLGETTPLRTKLARASLVGSALALIGCAIVAKRSDYTWPHVFFKESATLSLNRDAKPADDELLALLKKAAGPQASLLELSAKNGRATVTALSTEFRPYMGGSALTVEKGSHAQACLARLRDLLPAAAIHYSQINAQIPLGVFESRFASGRIPIAILAILGTLLATLAGGRRAAKVIGAGIALHLILIAAPAWENPRVVEGAPLPMFKAADIALAPDFSTPDKAVTSVYDAACWGNREVARRGMSKALAAGLDAQDGWDEFFERNAGRRMVATLLPKAKPDRFYNQLSVQTSYINRSGTATSGGHTWVVQEDGEWRLDQLTYVGKNGEITAPATWFANKKVADAAKAAAKPEPEVAIAPAPENLPLETKPMHIHFLPGNRIAVDGKAATPDEVIARLKQPNDGKFKWRFEVETEAGIEGRFVADVLQKMKAVGAKFDEDVMAKLRDSMKAEEATPAAPPKSPKLEAPVEMAKTPPAKTVISLRVNGDLELDGKPISLDDLATRLKPLAASEKSTSVSVTVEKDTPLEHALRLNETMLKAGVRLELGVTDKLLKASSYSISGQVNKPARRFIPDQPITVSMAVTIAGGPTRNANLGKVQLVRTDAAGATKTITVDVKKALEGKAMKDEDPVLEAGDKIDVPESGR